MLEVLSKCNLGPLTNTALQYRCCTTIFFLFLPKIPKEMHTLVIGCLFLSVVK